MSKKKVTPQKRTSGKAQPSKGRKKTSAVKSKLKKQAVSAKKAKTIKKGPKITGKSKNSSSRKSLLKRGRTAAVKARKTIRKAVAKVNTAVRDIFNQVETVAESVLNPLVQEDSTASEILKRMREAFTPTQLNLKNLSDAHQKHPEAKKHGGGHYSLSIVSDLFSGLDLQSRQRWVMNLVSDLMGKAIHALQMDLRSPEEVPLAEDAAPTLRRDFKIKPDKKGTKRPKSKNALQSAEMASESPTEIDVDNIESDET